LRTIKEDILRKLDEESIRFIYLQFTDLLGTLKAVSVPVTEIENILAGKVMFDGSSIQGFVRIEESDMCLVPDLSTFAILPWKDYPKRLRVLSVMFIDPTVNHLKGTQDAFYGMQNKKQAKWVIR